MLSPQDVELLEKKRLKYKIKQFFKIFIPIAILFSIVGVYFLIPTIKKLKDVDLNLTMPSFFKKQNETNTTAKLESETIKVDSVNSPLPIPNRVEPIENSNKNSSNKISSANLIVSNSDKNNTLKLHTSFLEDLDTKTNIDTPKETIESDLPKEEKKKASIQIDSKVVSSKPRPKVVRKKIIQDVPKEVDISFDGKNVSYLEKMFKKTNSFKYSIALAEEYYSKKEYQKSIKWAMISNDIDSKDERSWIYFAKSKVKLNQRNEAIEALRLFLKKNKSRGAAKLLSRIEHGAL